MARGRKDYEKAMIAVESEGFRNPHGRILMHDDFEDTPLKWITTGTGTWFVSRQARAAYNGGFGLELDITSDAPPTSRAASAARYIPIDITERLLFEFFWRANDMTRMERIEVTLEFYNGTHRHLSAVAYNQAAQYWEYWTAAGAWAMIPGSEQTFFNQGWNELTISADFLTNEYIVFKSNNLEINIGTLEHWHPLSGIGAHALVEIAAFNSTANQLLVSIDDTVVRELEV